MAKKKILVVLGGNSKEREISIKTGKACIAAIKRLGYKVERFDPKINSFFDINKSKSEIIFNALHGEEGEDGYALVSGGQPRNVVDGEANCGADGTSPCCKTGDGINRSGLWILTRQRNPTESLVNEVRDIATQMGFSTSVLFDVTHDDDCQVPGIDDDDNSVRFLRGLLMALGANMAEKASQKGARRLGDFPPVLGLGRLLEGSWRVPGGFLGTFLTILCLAS